MESTSDSQQQRSARKSVPPAASTPAASTRFSDEDRSSSRPPPPRVSARGQQPPRDVEISSRAADSSISTSKSQPEANQDDSPIDGWVEINDDVYSMFFLSKICGQAFWYAVYVFLLKLALYTFLITDALAQEQPESVSVNIHITQFFMLPVAIAVQQDLIGTYYLLANIKYSPLIRMSSPYASKAKFHVANFSRGIDGVYSLLVNFTILMKQTEVLTLFLSFAALFFLQEIDNVAIRLCENGYLSGDLEEAAERVMTTRLPRKTDEVMQSLDSVLFLSTLGALTIAWAIISFL